MAQVGGQQGQTRLHVASIAIPSQETINGKGMPHVVDARAFRSRRSPQARTTCQDEKYVAHCCASAAFFPLVSEEWCVRILMASPLLERLDINSQGGRDG